MDRKEFLRLRNELIKEAQNLIDTGDNEGYLAKEKEISDLDNKYDMYTKNQASLNALKDNNGVAPAVQNVLNTGSQLKLKETEPVEQENATNSLEYRKSFRNYVLSGGKKPTIKNEDENTLTTDIGSVIPEVIVTKIVEKLEKVGMILPLINKTAFPTGVKIPTSSVSPTATWVGEGQGSDRQKKTTGSIMFASFKLRCEISMSMESGTMALAVFETTFVNQVVKAMTKGIEGTIISTADGESSMKGILAETPPEGQAFECSKLSYKVLVDAEAALPEEYEGEAKWCMTKKTFMQFAGMTDANGQPIGKINYGIGGKPERYLLGREVVTCGKYMSSFSTALAAGVHFAFIFDFGHYAMNTVYNMGIQKKQDWDTEDLLTKAVMGVDGKVTDKNSLVTLKKK